MGTHFADGIPKSEMLFNQDICLLLERVGALSLVMRKLTEAELSPGALVSIGTTAETKERLYGKMGMKYWTPSLDVTLLKALLKYG